MEKPKHESQWVTTAKLAGVVCGALLACVGLLEVIGGGARGLLDIAFQTDAEAKTINDAQDKRLVEVVGALKEGQREQADATRELAKELKADREAARQDIQAMQRRIDAVYQAVR